MRELIDVPVAETVVRLCDAADAGRREAMVREFVLTRQVERNLRAVAGSLAEGRGRGHFLIGAYGSGKSHFLSYLSLVASGEAVPSGPCPVAEALGGKRLLPVRCSLVRVRNDVRLEDAILADMERALRGAGSAAAVSRRSRFLDHVDRSIRPLDPARMDAFLAQKGLPKWEALRGDPDRAVAAAWGYAQGLEGCPALPEMPPDGLLRDVLDAARAAGFAGVLVVVDELSEFLRSKPTRAALSEDARYLQLLGEFARAEPVWIVASVQEAIERSGDIARDVIAKIRDRYPAALPLDEHHVRELIGGRLVRKREGARERIRDVWRRFAECVPGFDIDFEQFFRIYPVHPATIRYLEGLQFLFSAHRGVVDFLVACVRGDASRGVAGLLEGPADRLLTADRIYPHFRDRIAGDSRFADFDAVVRRDLGRAIEAALSDAADRELAWRAVDVLILTELAEGEKPKTVAELAGILMAAVTDVSAAVNEQYLAEVVLAPLLRESLFLRQEAAERPGDRIFRVGLERDRRGLLQQELGRVLSGVPEGDARIQAALLESVPSALPIREMRPDAVQEALISWRGTQRRGAIFFSPLHSPDAVAEGTERAAADFAVVIAPADGGLEAYPGNAIVWVPGFADDDREAMRRYYGAMLLAGESDAASVEAATRDEAARTVEEGRPQIAKIIEAGYRRGAFLRPTGERLLPGGPPGAAGFFERCAAEPAIALLKSLHPRFLEVAPEVDFVSRRALSPLVDAVLAPGRISMAAARKNNTRTMIEGVLIPMGIARVQGPSFVMQLDPARSPLVREALETIAGGAAVEGFLQRFRRGPWGLSNEMASLLLVALVRGGLAELRKRGRRIPSGIVGFAQVEEVDEVQAGELIDERLRERLLGDAALAGGMEVGPFSLASQREAWERLLALRDRIRADAAEIAPRLAAISEYPVFDAFDFERVRAVVERGLEAVRGVEDSQGAGKGLAQYLAADRPDLALLSRELAALREFACSDADRVIRVADYLRELSPDSAMPEGIAGHLAEVRGMLARLTEVVLAGETPAIFAAFDRFFEGYLAWYVDEHRRVFARERFAPLMVIRETPNYLALQAASGISGIHLADGADVVDRRIDAALAVRCTRSPSAELRLKARCGCGFAPGDAVRVEDADAIADAVRAGLAEAARALADPAVLERIVARIAALKELDPEKAGRLEAIFHRLREAPPPEAFARLMTPEAARLLDKALRRRISVVPRDLGALVGRLSGRRLPPARLRAIFEEWLGDTGEGEVVVDLGGSSASSADGAIAAWIRDHGLDEAGARLALVVPPDVVAAAGDASFTVDEERLVRMAHLAGLPSADGGECFRMLSRERRCAKFAWEIARRIAQCLIDGWRPEPAGIACAFPEAAEWIAAAVSAAAPFADAPIAEMIRAESPREAAMAFLKDYRCLRQFPSEQMTERLQEAARRAAAARDEAFGALGAWDARFADILECWPDAAFLFVDAARWDLVPRLDAALREAAGCRIAEERWSLAPGASTAGWQRAFFGTDDADAIRAAMQHRGVRYAADAERADVCARLREEPSEVPVWLHARFVDRALHSTSLPVHRLLDAMEREFQDMLSGLSGVLGARRNIILLTDHGFSEVERPAAGGARYAHDPEHPADTVAAMIVYEGELRR